MTDEQLTQIRPGHEFALDQLEHWLASHVAGYAGPFTIEQFDGGQSNPTFRLTTPTRSYVLRKKPPGVLLPSAHLIEREFQIFTALQGSAVPVPATFGLCEDSAIIGTPFFIMEYVSGRLLRDPQLPTIPPAERRGYYDAMIATLAALHQVDFQAVGLQNFGKPGGYIERQIKRWSQQYKATETESIPAMDKMIEWLPANRPGDEITTLVHGDFRIDNLLFDPLDSSVLALLDWELATLGHPLSDLAYTCMYYHIALPDGYLGDVDEKSGIPTERELVSLYCHHTGRMSDTLPDWPFYMAFSLFRYAAIVQGVHYRGLKGNAASNSAARYGEVARRAANKAWEIIS